MWGCERALGDDDLSIEFQGQGIAGAVAGEIGLGYELAQRIDPVNLLGNLIIGEEWQMLGDCEEAWQPAAIAGRHEDELAQRIAIAWPVGAAGAAGRMVIGRPRSRSYPESRG